MKLDELKQELMQRADLRAEYEGLADQFSIAEALIRARTEAQMTQSEVAEKMCTSQSYVAKLDGGQVSPSMKDL